MEAQRQVSRELAEAYAKEEGLLFAEASAKSGKGVSELFIELGESLVYFLGFVRRSCWSSVRKRTKRTRSRSKRVES